VDWNGDGNTTDSAVASDVNCNGTLGIDQGSDDWAWIHTRLSPPAITAVEEGSPASPIATSITISGINLMAPTTVIFTGGVSAAGEDFKFGSDAAHTSFSVTIPLGAQSGPITLVTPVGTVTSSQAVQITPLPLEIAAGPDGNIWFTEWGASTVGRITPNGQVTEFFVPPPLGAISATPTGITAGPDGNVWFTESQGDKIGRITPRGAITEFPLPPGRQPLAIAAGPDGNLWFVEGGVEGGVGGLGIGRITPDGTLTEFPPGMGANCGEAIAAGPDGNLWCAGNVGDIGKITPDGASTFFALPDAGSETFGISAGPDGNVWFTEQGFTAATGATGGIGRSTPLGAITEFPLPPSHLPARSNGIAAGPDGNLWFTEPAGIIGQMTTSGALTEFVVPTPGSEPLGITAGPDGNLWFTEATGAIGRISPLGKIKEFSLVGAS
jgi:streptogramin lyase